VVIFDMGMWVVMEKVGDGVGTRIGLAKTLEEAVKLAAMFTGRPVGVSLIVADG
jgi:hypothetical protein